MTQLMLLLLILGLILLLQMAVCVKEGRVCAWVLH
jgi:hypothetical protein